MLLRIALLEYLARRFVALDDRPTIAIDGVDGSGKTTFADELVPLIERQGRPVIRASIDGFHNPRAIRYRRGKANPEGYFLDSYDYDGLRRYLLEPFRAGEAAVETARFDHKIDREVTNSLTEVPARAVLVLDGIFLHRDELHGLWAQSAFLVVPFAVSYARMASRDGTNPDPNAPENHRYLEGQNIYHRRCSPQNRATYLIDNSEIAAPKLLEDRSPRSVRPDSPR